MSAPHAAARRQEACPDVGVNLARREVEQLRHVARTVSDVETAPRHAGYRPRIAATIASPWKRPFSMKIRFVMLPDTIDPATNRPRTLVS
jgi:hypothetical protein